MGPSVEIPSLWNQLAETMYLTNSPTAEVSLSEQSSYAFGRVQDKQGLPDVARPIVGESGYLVALQLKAIPFIEQFLGKKRVSSGFYPVGAVSAIDLQDQPSLLLPSPFDSLVLYVTQDSLDEVAYAHRAPPVKQLAWPHGVFDPVAHQLGQILSASLEQSARTSRIFLDHVLHALKCHCAIAYGGLTLSSQSRGGLSPMQMRRATEFLEARLDGNIALREVADVCGLSVSHFARAFKQSFRRPPYKWLIERRVEKAKDLMMNSHLPIAEIAMMCGFADQSALNRSFKRIAGSTPGIWRRGTTCGTSDLWKSIVEDGSSHDEARS
jgi:AraC-like DNA-binding protein